MNETVSIMQQHPSGQGRDDRPLRILHVLDHSLPLHSGYSFRTLALLAEQRAMGWETIQLTGPKQGGGMEHVECVDNWIFHRTPPLQGLPARFPLLRHRALMQALLGRIDDIVESVCPDIIHAHSPVLNALPALKVGHGANIPVVYEVRAFWEDAAADHGTAREWGPRYRLTRALETRALRQADAVTTICEGLRRDMLERGVSADRITVIPNAVDVSAFRFRPPPDNGFAQQFGLTHGKTLGFAGSFYAYEGLDLLLQAMPQILRVEPKARLLLVGGGAQEASLKSLTAELGIKHAVHFTGRVPHAEVERYYSVMDVMVYPRLSRRLTQLVTPLKPLEAMALGKLVVASDVGGHGELISDGSNGHLFRAGSVDALAACLVKQLATPETWSDVIERGRSFVEQERTWKTSASRYRAVYADVLDRRQQDRRGRLDGH